MKREETREADWEQYARTLPSDTTVNYHRIRQGFDAGYQAGSEGVERLRTALEEIAKGEGRFSRDPLTHAANTIEDMTALAKAALED